MNLEFILIAIMCSFMRKDLRKRNQLPAWQNIFTIGLVFSIFMIVLPLAFKGLREATNWFAHGLTLVIIWFAIKNPLFQPIKSRLFIVLPLLVVKIISDVVRLINKSFYNSLERYFQIAILFSLIWVVVMAIINNKQRKALALSRQKAEEREKEFQISEKLKAQLEIQVAERTSELTLQKKDLEMAIQELKATQSQLIQAEKMASLGELTAGIAHEIQNPLNFVNNFSEVSNELFEEMTVELEKGHMQEAKEIAGDIKQNLEKIVHHGKRADAIVKGMLQHSRSNTGTKEPTDINALCDEYFRLAYHGLRAKDKSFNAKLNMHFDESLSGGNSAAGSISIVPQDMGRAILNLINNAFYAVAEKKSSSQKANGASLFEPTVSISTKKKDGSVFITVQDNGNGIPQEVVDKIFQPFFTTKPTGQGTGLGLSLTYDIVKAHGGELLVETKEGEGTVFTIKLPDSSS